MIEFDSYYFIAEEDVEAIIKSDSGQEDFPFRLTVRVKNGREYSVSFKRKTDRDRIAKQFAQQVERSISGRDRTLESIYNRLYLMDDRLRRVDKRGLRIWQQLKALLGVEVQE